MATSLMTPQISLFSNILEARGIDLKDENFKDTPKRWLKYLDHYLQPYEPKDDLGVTFGGDTKVLNSTSPHLDIYLRSMVIQSKIPYRAVCAHHLLPVIGVAHVAYIPKKRVVGLSKLARVVYGFSHKTPSLQEIVCNEIATALHVILDAIGAVCVISATHGCMACRGVEEPGVITTTSSLRGVFTNNAEARAEFYQLVGMS